KDARKQEHLGQLLDRPPGILAAETVVVVAAADPIQFCGIQRVPPRIPQRTVAAAIHRDLCVSMEFSAQEAIFSSVDPGAIVPEQTDARAFGSARSRWIRRSHLKFDRLDRIAYHDA